MEKYNSKNDLKQNEKSVGVIDIEEKGMDKETMPAGLL